MPDGSDIPSFDQASTGPPSLVSALRSYWFVLAGSVAVFVVLALVAGFARAPTYETQAELNVGQTDIATQALPGFQDGAVSLADSYSRVVQSQQITEPVARRLRVPVSEIEDRLSAVPVPERTVFRIKATGDSAAKAERLARVATGELRSYVDRLSTSESETAQTLSLYRRTAAEVQRLTARVNRLENSDAPGAQIRKARVDVTTARLRLQGLAQQYQQARPTASGATVQVLNAPDSATSDRSSVTQQYLIIAIVLGLLVGLAIAITLSGRAFRRALQGF